MKGRRHNEEEAGVEGSSGNITSVRATSEQPRTSDFRLYLCFRYTSAYLVFLTLCFVYSSMIAMMIAPVRFRAFAFLQASVWSTRHS